MTFRFVKTMPRRMVVLSLLPPPTAFEPPRPYGYGAFIVERRGASEAAFCLRVHGYGARYDPVRLREDIRALFTPETQALIYAPLSSDICRHRPDQRLEGTHSPMPVLSSTFPLKSNSSSVMVI